MKQKIIIWIKRQLRESGAKGIVLGLSGGVDSAVTAVLAKQAVGRNNLLALLMPCKSHTQDIKDARFIARRFGIKSRTIDLSGLYDNFLKLLPPANSLARNNLKPRLRMATLYYFANKFNYLVCGTGNKSELMVGYFTKYGDGGVDILPIGDLFKRQVVELAGELGIPQRIVNKPPSAGLWHGQTDEGEMGITYAELDDILDGLCSGRRQKAARAKVNKVRGMYGDSAHKREGAAICRI